MATHVTPVGRFLFPALVEPRENLNRQLEWSVVLEVGEQEAAPIIQVIEETVKEFRSKNPTFPPDNMLQLPIGPAMRKNEAGEKVAQPGLFHVRFKRLRDKLDRRTGMSGVNPQPVVYDSMGSLVETPPAITTGSDGKVIYRSFAYSNANKGVGFYLMGVQLYKLNQEVINLPPLEGGWTPNQGEQEEQSLSELLASHA